MLTFFNKIVLNTYILSACFIATFASVASAQTIVSKTGSYEIGVRQSVDVFSEIFDPQNITSFHLGVDNNYGKYLLRANIVNRFDQTGYQWESEAYPLFGNGVYGYLSYAYSGASITSRHRAGLELYVPWPKRSESSLGVRYLNFSTGSESWIATASFNHYLGNYLITLRPYLIFSDSGNGQTYFASVRRFLNEQNDYLIVRFAAGVAADRSLFQLGDELAGEQVLLLESYQAGVELRKHLIPRLIGIASLDYFKQELSFDEGNFVDNWSFKAGLILLF